VNLEEKHKVTFYISPELHRQLKIQAALGDEPMSTLAERALGFYLTHPEVIEERLGQTHRLYSCPSCETPVVLRDGDLTVLPTASVAVLEDTPPRLPEEVPVLSLR